MALRLRFGAMSRLHMASYFDLPPRVQARYRPYLAEWFVAAHLDRFPS